ncbi:MAG TPA: glycosyltransferase family 4 protein, partial [Myxococcota bacterium]|nr:glycosyltransferase family 4 protein [Myxococcota bacterium]
GPLAPTLERARARCARGEIVRTPAVQPDELAAHYAASRLLVFASLGEPWGLVVNEAFACARPVLCSSLAGCADDLMRPGENGWIVDPTLPCELAASLREALEHPDLERLGIEGRRTVDRFGPEPMAAGIRAAVESCSRGESRASAVSAQREHAVRASGRSASRE